MPTATILCGDVRQRLAELPDGSVQECITSPPYWGLRDYGHDGQIGLEKTPDEYVAGLVEVFREVRRVLADDGTLWLNLGDSYASGEVGRHDGYNPTRAGGTGTNKPFGTRQQVRPRTGLKPKDLVGIPWRVAFALQADGWWLRQDIIWAKPNPMPESVTDRCTKAHEYVFLLAKSDRYLYDRTAIWSPAATAGGKSGFATTGDAGYQAVAMGRKPSGNQIPEKAASYVRPNFANKRSVWTIPTKPYAGAHFAVMPEALVEPCILAGSRPCDLVLDPFAGSGTVGVVALRHNRHFIGVELNPEYAALAETRIRDDGPLFNDVKVAG